MIGNSGEGQDGYGIQVREGSDDEDEDNDDYGFFEQKGLPYRVTLQKMKELI